MVKTHSSQTYEKLLFRYGSALDRGDFETVEAILRQAEDDPYLEQMILEINDMHILIMEKQQQEKQRKNRLPNLRSRLMGSWIGYAAAAVLVVSITGLIFLTFTSRRSLTSQPGGIEPTALAVGALPAATAIPHAASTDWPAYGTADFYGYAATPAMGLPPQQTPTPMFTTTPQTMIEVTPVGGSNPTRAPAQPQGPMIIKNGEIDLLVKDANAAIDQVTQIATDNGGYVLSSQTYLDGSARYATMTIAVRADQFETAMRRLRQSAIKVLRELATGQDVSTEYVDLQSRLRNLEATRDRIKAFLDEAATVPEALEVNQQLANIEAEIEQVVGRMTYLSGRSAYSTITVNVQEEFEATPTPTPTATPTLTPTPLWSLGPTIERATETQVSLGRGLLEMMAWLLIVPGPYLAALGVVAMIIWAINRRKDGPSSKPPQSGS